MATTPPDTPPGWTVQWSPEFQCYFYANKKTGLTQWHRPSDDETPLAGTRAAPAVPPPVVIVLPPPEPDILTRIDSLISQLTTSAVNYLNPPRIATMYVAPPLPVGWSAQWSVQYGRWFFINTRTGASQWDLPPVEGTSGEPLPAYAA